jgi:proteasome accessory factor B
MDRTERLLDLVTLLLDAKSPVTWAALARAFPDEYGTGSPEATDRKFSRDKAELLELGVPLRFEPGEDGSLGGYVVDKGAYLLPDLGLSAEELAVLYAAGAAALESGAFPGQRELEHALRKVSFFSDGHIPPPRVRVEATSAGRPIATTLETLWAAIGAKKFVTLTYASPKATTPTQRRVDPYGLALRRGSWWLVGFCHLRSAIRTFLVHRIVDCQANTSKPKSTDFALPEGYRLEEHLANWPWQHRFHEAETVEVRLSGALAEQAPVLFGDSGEADASGVTLTLKVTDRQALARYALSLGPHCVVSASPTLTALQSLATRLAQAHGATHG